MSVKRIQKIDIHNRPFLTAIYGITGIANKQECFIEPNLVTVNRWQELYLYLKEENYDALFYNKELGFWGYEKKTLQLILKPKKHVEEEGTSLLDNPTLHTFVFDCSSPNGTNRKNSIRLHSEDAKGNRQTTNNQDNADSLIQSIQKPQYGGLLYNLTRQSQIKASDIIRYIQTFAETNPDYPLAFIVTNPQEITFSDRLIEEDITGLMNIHKGARMFNTRLLIMYDVDSAERLFNETNSTAFFCTTSIIDFFKQQEDQNSNNPSLFYIEKPDRQEYENWLNRIRILKLVKSEDLYSFSHEKLLLQLEHIGISIQNLNAEFMQRGMAFFESFKVEDFSEELLSKSLSKIHGQQDNLQVIKERVVSWINEPDDDEKRPLNFMLAGPTGTGKTYTAELISETLKGRGYISVYIPMNQYTNEADTWRLFGSTTGYSGSTEDPKIIAARKKSEKLVIVFDEIEKAHISLYTPLMNLLDKGIVENGRGEEFDFRNSIIFFTTNLAQKKLTERKKFLVSSKISIEDSAYQEAIIKILLDEKKFLPEFLGRFNCFFVYNNLSKETIAEIAVEEIRKQGKRRNILINDVAKELLLSIANESAESTTGARNIRNLINSKLSKKLDKIKLSLNNHEDNLFDLVGEYQLIKSQHSTILPVFEVIEAISKLPDYNQHAYLSDDEILSELDSMVGMAKVKEAISGIIADVKAKLIRAQFGQSNESKINLNFVFKGNPGTGKTTVAMLLGKILANYGLIDQPEVVKYTKGNLIDGHIGGGSRNVEKMFEDSVGKVLFIDEAYQLADNDAKDALDAITNMLTDPRFEDKLAVVLAGYPGNMAELINGNPGLKDRFTQDIFFEDYSNDEITEIFYRMLTAENFVIDDEALIYARAYISSIKRDKSFSNGRKAKNLRDIVKMSLANRLLKITNPTKEEAFTILPQDFPNYGKINPDNYRNTREFVVSPIDKLNSLIGIEDIRQQFKTYIDMAHYCQDNPQATISGTFRPHMAFLGNPGTGKTTVARLFAEILRQEELLTNSNFVEVGPTDLIGEYLGQSGPKARSQFERARGGVLFIDEAYQLCRKDQLNGGDQYGKEVITELIKFMEDDRDTIVILAGYTEEIRYLIQKGNPGLASRVTNEFIFEDYTPDILFNILLQKLKEYEISDEFKSEMRQILDYAYDHRSETEWGNARTIENYANAIFKIFLKKHKAKGIIDCDCIPSNIRINK